MEVGITSADRATLLRTALSKLAVERIRDGLARVADAHAQLARATLNAANAMRRQRDPLSALGRAQYRSVLSPLAAVLADDCLAATIEALGEHADDPTEEELLTALDALRPRFDDATVAVMLASVAGSDLQASELCYRVVTTDARFGVATVSRDAEEVPEGEPTPVDEAPAGRAAGQTVADRSSEEQRAARRERKRRESDQRRRRASATERAAEEARLARRRSRPKAEAPTRHTSTGTRAARVVPQLMRKPVLTPVQAEEFDPDDPWVGGVVYAWVPFDRIDPEAPELDGKSRRSVVVAGSATHLLVRPGYSEGGVKGRTWKSVPLTEWRRAGFDQPTAIDVETVRIDRPEDGPIGWLGAADWNALW